MTKFKKILSEKRIKQVEIARDLKIDASTICMFFSGWKKIPEKHHEKLRKCLGLNPNEFNSMLKDGWAV